MTTQEASVEVEAGIHAAAFTSRRNLVIRRFFRNTPAVVAAILLVVGFVGCYALAAATALRPQPS